MTSLDERTTAPVRVTSKRPSGPLVWLRAHLVQIAAAAALFYMFLPVMYVVAFSFNKPAGKDNTVWQEFSTEAWTDFCGVAGMCDALRLSLLLGVAATIGSVILGTLVAFAISRHRFRGRSAANLLIFLPMATPEIVLGASLLTLFVNVGAPRGTLTILIAHIVFCLSFVVVTVKARIASLDPRLEQAAMDLYADERTTFMKVTLPLVMPGIIGASLLAFSLSFDDYIVTAFNAGSVVTFPISVWGQARIGLPPQYNVVGALMFFIALAVVIIGQVLNGRRAKA
jgi:spermidine/putrescine transport system permease protein